MKKIILFAAVVLSAQAEAFTLNSQTDSSFRGWDNPEISFNVNAVNCPAGMDIPGLITEAVKVWNNVPTSRLKIAYNSGTTSTTYANPTTVYCETNFQTVTHADQNYVPAAASVMPSGHNAVGGLLYLNVSAGQANISLYDHTMLLVIIAHEVGHILGLGHSQEPSALMYFNASGKSALTLGQDDIDGISYLYPRDELGSDKMMGCGLVKSGGSAPPPRSGFLALLALLLLLPVAVYAGLRFRAWSTTAS
jgi:hypothetical protein